MSVFVEGEVPRYLSYSVLRNPVQQVSANVAKVEDDDDDSIPRLPARKKPRSQKEKPLEVDMINANPVLPDGDIRTSVPLTCAPRTNGFLVIGNKGLDRGYTCTFEMLEYVISRKTAFVSLTWDESADFTGRIQASSVKLREDNYITVDPVNLDRMVCPIDRGYAVFSAIKRAFGLCRKKNSVNFNVCPAITFTRRCAGFEADSARDNVRMSKVNLSNSNYIHRRLLTKSSETLQDDSFFEFMLLFRSGLLLILKLDSNWKLKGQLGRSLN